jgi:hypothetical protein
MRSEFNIKIVIIVSVFLLGLIIFKGLQNDYIFKNTLGRIAFTYENISKTNTLKPDVDVIKTEKPYTTLDEANFIHWDVKFFKYMSENGYGKDTTWPGEGTHAFSPLFPFIWRLSHLPAQFIVILNYLLFAFSLVILSNLFLTSENYGKTDRLLLFTFALTLPSVFCFYLPYCESTFMFTMSIALWGLFKKKLWLFYIGLFLFALSRPSFLIVGAAIICTDIYFLILNKDFKSFIKELGIKFLPILIGVLLTFFIQYLVSGNFFKMFEVHKMFWQHTFQYPRTITDWSIEGYGMNIFAMICVAIPAGLVMFTYFLKHYEARKVPHVSLFSAETVKQYLFGLSIVYFVGNFLFVFFHQGGNLNGMHRYILVSPFFYIFLFILAPKIRTMKLIHELGILIAVVFIGYLFLIYGPYQHKITFLDSGYFLLVIASVYFILFDRLKLPVRVSLLVLIALCNTVWLTYLYNHFLNNAFIIA